MRGGSITVQPAIEELKQCSWGRIRGHKQLLLGLKALVFSLFTFIAQSVTVSLSLVGVHKHRVIRYGYYLFDLGLGWTHPGRYLRFVPPIRAAGCPARTA